VRISQESDSCCVVDVLDDHLIKEPSEKKTEGPQEETKSTANGHESPLESSLEAEEERKAQAEPYQGGSPPAKQATEASATPDGTGNGTSVSK